MSTSGTLYIISAPSGGGKTSLISALLQSVDNIEVSVSYTTRPPRPGEKNGTNYHFVDETTFKKLIAENIFLEHAKVFDHYYGTSRLWVEKKLQAGIDIILEIDWQGARQIRTMLPETMSIFIIPPTKEVLEKRLRGRAQDPDSVIVKRMTKARGEMSHYDEYDYLIVNNLLIEALDDLKAIILARRLRANAPKDLIEREESLRMTTQQNKQKELLNSLLA